MLNVTFPTWNPSVLTDMAEAKTRAKRVQARGRMYVPPAAAGRAPAVVVIEDAVPSGYGEKLAAQGFVALAPEPRAGDAAQLADTFAALRFLAAHPLVDPESISVLGLGRGGMIAVLAAYQRIRSLFIDDDLRFAGHVSYYGHSAPRLDDATATGAPVLMLLGGQDRNVSIDRSRHIAADLTRGGALVEIQVHPQGHHGWAERGDSRFQRFGLALRRVRLDTAGRLRDERTGLVIRGPVTRALSALCGLDWSGHRVVPDETVTRETDEAALSFLETISTALPARPAERARRQA